MNIHIISIKSNQNLPRLNKLIGGRNRRSPEDFIFMHIREQLFRVIWSYLPLVCRKVFFRLFFLFAIVLCCMSAFACHYVNGLYLLFETIITYALYLQINKVAMWNTAQSLQMFMLCYTYSLQYGHGHGKISKITLFGWQTQTLIDIKSLFYYSNPQICVKFNEQFILKGKEHAFNNCVPPLFVYL